MDGVLLIKKEKDITSSDVVVRLRKILNTKKVGHTGTLDPLATGLLVVTVGKATKISELLTTKYKEYIATMKLGVKTDTYDITGNVIDTCKVPSNLDFEAILKEYQTTYMQEVPIYSSVKVKGKKLYEYARKGEEVELPKKEVEIKEIELLNVEGEYVTFRCVVSKGTYIRSLINDIGNDIGCFACMSDLVRTKVDKFSLEDAYSLDDISNNKYELINIVDALDYPKITVDGDIYNKIIHGMKIDNTYNIKDRCVFVDTNDNLLGIYEVDNMKLKVWKNFV